MALALPSAIQAVCPLCTIAVGAGLGLSRWLGIDDTITGVWIGGLLLSSSFWLASFAQSRNWRYLSNRAISAFLFYVLTLPPLYLAKMIGMPDNTFFGIDKLLLGTLLGSLVFYFAVKLDLLIREKNEDKVLIYYQKVIIPVFLLSLLSYVFYLST